MSETNKPRQFWLAAHHSDPDELRYIWPDSSLGGIHVIELAPVLKMMDEMAEALNSSISAIASGYSPHQDAGQKIYQSARESVIARIESYKTFKRENGLDKP